MQREDMKDLIWFLEVAKARSFTRAAAQLGTSQSTLSHTIRQLEARLGVRLLTRTTRSVSTTEAGERLLQSLAPRFEEIEAELAGLVAYRDTPSGTVRLTLSDHALQGLVDIAVQWLESGATPTAKEAHASSDTKFISSHPARTYELLTDTAKQHGLDHMKLLSSVIEPVILPLGHYVGARQAAAGVKVDMSGQEPEQKETK